MGGLEKVVQRLQVLGQLLVLDVDTEQKPLNITRCDPNLLSHKKSKRKEISQQE